MLKQEMHLRDYIRVILKRKSTVFTFFLITFIVVVIGTFAVTPQYQASTKILVDKNRVDPLYGGRPYYAPNDLEFIETQSQIIRSKSVARRVVKNLDLEKNYQSYFPDKYKSPGFLQIMITQIKDFIKDFTSNGNGELVASEAASIFPGDGYETLENDWITDTIISH